MESKLNQFLERNYQMTYESTTTIAATPAYDKIKDLHGECFLLLGTLQHLLDHKYYPEVDREKMLSVLNKMEVLQLGMISPMVDLMCLEIRCEVNERLTNNS